ncbi:hypothetical protein TNCV_1350011 [Trichonephila clavipes]|nr:hypothetical protein TNCV_1350011 [Trichonephila clavipes]
MHNIHWCAKIKDEVEKLAYQLNEEAERTERPIRRLNDIWMLLPEIERLALQDEWAAMPQQLIDTLILSMGRRCETCLAVREDHIPY